MIRRCITGMLLSLLALTVTQTAGAFAEFPNIVFTPIIIDGVGHYKVTVQVHDDVGLAPSDTWNYLFIVNFVDISLPVVAAGTHDLTFSLILGLHPEVQTRVILQVTSTDGVGSKLDIFLPQQLPDNTGPVVTELSSGFEADGRFHHHYQATDPQGVIKSDVLTQTGVDVIVPPFVIGVPGIGFEVIENNVGGLFSVRLSDWQGNLTTFGQTFNTTPTDGVAPTSTYALSCADNGVGVTLSATDDKDPSPTILYRLNGGPESPYTNQLVVNGNTTISFHAKDAAGNTEVTHNLVLSALVSGPSTNPGASLTLFRDPVAGIRGCLTFVSSKTLTSIDVHSSVIASIGAKIVSFNGLAFGDLPHGGTKTLELDLTNLKAVKAGTWTIGAVIFHTTQGFVAARFGTCNQPLHMP